MKREIFIGPVGIGGSHPVSIQSMTKTPTVDVVATLKQIRGLDTAGCQIVRVAIPDRESLPAFRRIVARSPLPVVADVHFDAALAVEAIGAGAHGLRINPGNIGSPTKLKEILRLAKERSIPIRIGINAGSLAKKTRRLRLGPAERMVHSALEQIKFFEDQGFRDIKISLKSSDVNDTIAAYELIDQRCPYPLHLGVTESGTLLSGAIKSALGIGHLLRKGIGNTIRVSLAADPLQEVIVARHILQALDRNRAGIELVACPTCGRTSVDLLSRVRQFEDAVIGWRPRRRIKVAIMGCEVNGPGEAADADIGLAFSRRHGLIFRTGQLPERVEAKDAVARLVELVRALVDQS